MLKALIMHRPELLSEVAVSTLALDPARHEQRVGRRLGRQDGARRVRPVVAQPADHHLAGAHRAGLGVVTLCRLDTNSVLPSALTSMPWLLLPQSVSR